MVHRALEGEYFFEIASNRTSNLVYEGISP